MSFFKKKWVWISLGSLLCLGIGTLLLVRAFIQVPDFTVLRTAVSMKIRTQDGRESNRRVGPSAAGWVPLSQVSDNVLYAVISSEDTSFFSHEGIDLYEIREAIKRDLRERRFARGASTITQQVVKNLFLTNEKTIWRKIKEIVWARELEKVLSKTEILAYYVNLAEFGPGIYGVGSASSYYFALPPAYLSAKQSAFLAMLLPSPRKYHKNFEDKKLSEWADKRVNRILRVMFRMKFINEPTYEQAKLESLWPEAGESDGTLMPPIAVDDSEDIPTEDDSSSSSEGSESSASESSSDSDSTPEEASESANEPQS